MGIDIRLGLFFFIRKINYILFLWKYSIELNCFRSFMRGEKKSFIFYVWVWVMKGSVVAFLSILCLFCCVFYRMLVVSRLGFCWVVVGLFWFWRRMFVRKVCLKYRLERWRFLKVGFRVGELVCFMFFFNLYFLGIIF